jgi:hypothetical protein
MARALRIEYPGAIYHVMNRGDRREPIFHEDRDHSLFLKTLAEATLTDRLAGSRVLSVSVACSTTGHRFP